jgi:anti-anti-sigma regulatory factor
MTSQKLSEHALMLVLAEEPCACQDIAEINEMIAAKCDVDIIIDFSRVELLTSATVSNMLILRDRVRAAERKLVLYNVAFTTKCILTTLGVHNAFKIVPDKLDAVGAILCTAG